MDLQLRHTRLGGDEALERASTAHGTLLAEGSPKINENVV